MADRPTCPAACIPRLLGAQFPFSERIETKATPGLILVSRDCRLKNYTDRKGKDERIYLGPVLQIHDDEKYDQKHPEAGQLKHGELGGGRIGKAQYSA